MNIEYAHSPSRSTVEAGSYDRPDEQGIALVLALFLVAALSVLGGSLMFLSQTETYASMNYRMMSQARYGAESGVQKTANFLLSSAQYGAPSTPAANPSDTVALYKRDVSPVLCVSGCAVTGTNPAATPSPQVVLSSTTGIASNYPVTAVSTSFNTATKGSLAAGNGTVAYSAVARLLSMETFNAMGGGPAVIQTWEVTGTGTLTGARNATVEVVAIIETSKTPASSYPVYATGNGCAALNFSGNSTVDSYDSTNLSGSTVPVLSASGGDVGTNGNLTMGGNVAVQGNLYTPRTGTGSCSSGNVTAFSATGSKTIAGSIVQLPAPLAFPAPPAAPHSILPATTISSASALACVSLGLTVWDAALNPTGQCKYNTAAKTIEINGYGTPLTLPSASVEGGIKIILVANSPNGTYNVNSLDLTGGSSIGARTTSKSQTVLLNVAGKNNTGAAIATPLDLTGGALASPDLTGCGGCSSYDASIMQITYAGTGNLRIGGSGTTALTVYAPSANLTLAGGADVYGSLLVGTLAVTGNSNVHYDRRLLRDFYVIGNPMASSFTWKRY